MSRPLIVELKSAHCCGLGQQASPGTQRQTFDLCSNRDIGDQHRSYSRVAKTPINTAIDDQCLRFNCCIMASPRKSHLETKKKQAHYQYFMVRHGTKAGDLARFLIRIGPIGYFSDPYIVNHRVLFFLSQLEAQWVFNRDSLLFQQYFAILPATIDCASLHSLKTMSETNSNLVTDTKEERTDTPSESQDELAPVKYPSGPILVIIVIALMLSMFLVSP